MIGPGTAATSEAGGGRLPVRVAVHADLAYRRDAAGLSADQAFGRFLGAMAGHVDRLVVIGRLDPAPGRWPHPLPAGVAFAALPHYDSLADVPAAARAAGRSLGRLWRALDDVDVLWLIGPHPLALPAALVGALRGRRVVLGVRQDFPVYVRTRHPQRRLLWGVADALELAFRGLARVVPVVAVGPDVARRYRHAPAVLELLISLVPERLLAGEGPTANGAGGRLLSVGRLEAEKNPLLLADVLASLLTEEADWRLMVCGDGSQAPALAGRLAALGVAKQAALRGELPSEDGLMDAYRSGDVLLHVSWTEGVPQVILEAFAAGLPVVATAVGGVAEAVGSAAVLIPPGDAQAAADAVRRLRREPATRRRMVARGRAIAREHSLEASSRRVASFLAAAAGPELTVEPLAGFDAVEPAWSRLSEAAGEVFRTPEWAQAWWRHHGAGRALRLAHLRAPDGRLVAVLPLYRAAARPVPVLRFLGHGEGDRLGPVCAAADRPAVAMSLRHVLRELGGRSALLVGDQLPREEGWSGLAGAAGIRGEDAPSMRIDGLSWEDVLAARSRNFREQVAARERRLRRKHDVRLRLTDDAAALPDDLQAFARLHDARWGGSSTAFAGARGAFHRDFAAMALDRGWLRLWLLEVDGAPRAGLLGYRLGGVECLYQLGRDLAWDRSSVGFVLVAHAVRCAVQDGMSEYRFLRGGEGYKARFATDDPGLETIALGRGAGRGAARAAGALPRLPARARHRLAAAVT
ncbi:MAG: hypothetical protein QOC78_4103 [Solirubrobacteraceae bacterium]|nr:hypothetical protein [Solirubrobacteraceae bacterium]